MSSCSFPLFPFFIHSFLHLSPLPFFPSLLFFPLPPPLLFPPPPLPSLAFPSFRLFHLPLASASRPARSPRIGPLSPFARGSLLKNEQSTGARLLLGTALLEGGDPAAAEVEFRKAEVLGASNEQVAPDLARAMLLTGQAGKVVEQFGELTLRDPAAQAGLKAWVASAYAQLGNQQQAKVQIAAALRAQPLNPAAVVVQARMRASEGDVDGALSMLDAVLSKEPNNEQVGVAKGYLLWLGKNDAAGALAVHRRVLASNPGSVAARAEIVTILFRQGKVAEARQEFEQLKKIGPHPDASRGPVCLR